ncbi:Hypothetical predicted protein, partial [Pelobates cultripes]
PSADQVGLQDGDNDSGESQDSSPPLPTTQEGEGKVTPALIQNMLDAQSNKLLAHFQTSISDLKKEIQAIGDRTEHLENKLETHAAAHITMLTKIKQLEAHISSHDNKLADLEDRSRRNNLRLRGIPESVAVGDLQAFATNLFQNLCPDIPAQMLLLDRIHRVAKAKAAPVSAPRDVLLRAHYHHIKEEILRASRTNKSLAEVYKDIQIFADISPATLAARRLFTPVTTALRKHQIQYRWGLPSKLLIIRNGQATAVLSPEDGIQLLNKWNIQPADSPQTPNTLPPEWKR